MPTDDDLVPVAESSQLINPAMARFLGAPDGTPVTVQVDGARYPVTASFYDVHDERIVLVVKAGRDVVNHA